MAVIIRAPRETRIIEPEARGVKEALLAGPAFGCNRFTLRRITIAREGRTARKHSPGGVVYFIHSGTVTLSHENGGLDTLEAGDSAVVHKDEVHHIQNVSGGNSIVLAASPQ